MRRTSIMTWGFVLIFIGIQLNLVQRYELTPRFSNFLSENGGATYAPTPMLTNNKRPPNSPYYQASYASNPASRVNQPAPVFAPSRLKVIDVPSWLCWPVLFLGAVVFLQGLSKRN